MTTETLIARYLTFTASGSYRGTGTIEVTLYDVDLSTAQGVEDAYYGAALQVHDSGDLPDGSVVAVTALHATPAAVDECPMPAVPDGHVGWWPARRDAADHIQEATS